MLPTEKENDSQSEYPKPGEITPELLVEQIERLSAVIVEGYQQLVEDPVSFIIDASSTQLLKREQDADRKPLEELLPYFLPLRKPQMQKLLVTSEWLGIPLSPLGLITFWSSRVSLLSNTLMGKNKTRNTKGEFVPGKHFHSGPLEKLGLWIINPSRVNVVVSESPSLLSPIKGDMKNIYGSMTHEAAHAVHLALRPDLLAPQIDTMLFREAYAYRTNAFWESETYKDIFFKFIRSYIPKQAVKENQNVAFELAKMIDPGRNPVNQHELTMRFLLAKNLQELMNPSEDLLNECRVLSQLMEKQVMPKFKENLSDVRQRSN
jgi:hypothetical protein